VPGLGGVLAGVLGRGRVAAAHVATGQAEPQVHPGAVDSETVLTPVLGVRLRIGTEFGDLLANGHGVLLVVLGVCLT
jgi:hypothetical protein